MFAQNNKISIRQLEVMLLLYFFGTAVLFLPAELAEVAGNACWLVALFWGIMATSVALLLSVLGQKQPDFSPMDWYCHAFGTPLGKALGILLGIKLIFDGAMELRIFAEIVSSSMLPKTPLWLLMAVILLVCAFAAQSGVECSGRIAELLFFFMLLPLAVVLLAVAVTSTYGRVLPITLPTLGETWKSSVFFAPIFQGIGVLLFAFPFLQKPERAGKRFAVSTLVATIIFSAIVFLSLAVYGEDVLAKRLMPTLQMMERVSFTGIFLGRQDLLLLWIWMASCFLFVTATLFFSTHTWQKACPSKRRMSRFFLWCSLLLVFVVGLLPKDLAGAYFLRLQVTPWSNGIFLVVLPMVLLLLEQGKRGRKGNG